MWRKCHPGLYSHEAITQRELTLDERTNQLPTRRDVAAAAAGRRPVCRVRRTAARNAVASAAYAR